MIRKAAGIVLTALLFFDCGGSKSGVRKMVEDGVEVVLNPAEPFQLKSKPLAASSVSTSIA